MHRKRQSPVRGGVSCEGDSANPNGRVSFFAGGSVTLSATPRPEALLPGRSRSLNMEDTPPSDSPGLARFHALHLMAYPEPRLTFGTESGTLSFSRRNRTRTEKKRVGRTRG